MSPSEEPE